MDFGRQRRVTLSALRNVCLRVDKASSRAACGIPWHASCPDRSKPHRSQPWLRHVGGTTSSAQAVAPLEQGTAESMVSPVTYSTWHTFAVATAVLDATPADNLMSSRAVEHAVGYGEVSTEYVTGETIDSGLWPCSADTCLPDGSGADWRQPFGLADAAACSDRCDERRQGMPHAAR